MVANYSAADSLRDGSPVVVRAIRPDDAEAIRESFTAMDRDSVFMRFFTHKKSIPDDELRAATDVDFDHVVALVVTVPKDGRDKLIGGGRYITGEAGEQRGRAELAFITVAGYRGKGIATLVLKHLLRIGRSHGVVEFEAEVLAQNTGMLEVFRRSGLPMHQKMEGNVVHVTLSLV